MAAGFSYEKQLGSGAYGTVVQLQWMATKRSFAVKRMGVQTDQPRKDKVVLLRAWRELVIMRALRGRPHILPLETAAAAPEDDFSDVYLLSPAALQDLHRYENASHWQVPRGPGAPPRLAWGVGHLRYWLVQILLGIRSLVEAQIVHRDIKPSNILLLKTDGTVKLVLCDFGLARTMNAVIDAKDGLKSDDTSDKLTSNVATTYYRAPELLFNVGGLYDDKVDMWSAGCVFAELLLLLRHDDAPGPLAYEDFAAEPQAAMAKRKADELERRRNLTLFQGTGKAEEREEGTKKARLEQLVAIVSKLGWDRSSLAGRDVTDTARDTLQELPAHVDDPGALEKRVSLLRDEKERTDALDLLRKMLAFYPQDRISVQDALKHPFLAPIMRFSDVARDLKRATAELSAPMHPRVHKARDHNTTMPELRGLFLHEVKEVVRARAARRTAPPAGSSAAANGDSGASAHVVANGGAGGSS